MIAITGARGFIGSNLVEFLNQKGFKNLILVDELENERKNRNLSNVQYKELMHRDVFLTWFQQNASKIQFVYHLGARTDTAEFDIDLFKRMNVNYSKKIFEICTEFQIPLVYASSAATYGNIEHTYSDSVDINTLKPLNPYGNSKQIVDLWVAQQKQTPPFFAALKFFNVYGKGEWHKDRMASVIYHAYGQIKATGKMKLFQSHREDIDNGEQRRDFIYVKDLVQMCYFFQECFEENKKVESGIYNIGTGKARTFNDLVKATFVAMDKKVDISYIPIPEDIRDKYQYFTEANMQKIRKAGYQKAFTSLEDGIKDYVQSYLALND